MRWEHQMRHLRHRLYVSSLWVTTVASARVVLEIIPGGSRVELKECTAMWYHESERKLTVTIEAQWIVDTQDSLVRRCMIGLWSQHYENYSPSWTRIVHTSMISLPKLPTSHLVRNSLLQTSVKKEISPPCPKCTPQLVSETPCTSLAWIRKASKVVNVVTARRES